VPLLDILDGESGRMRWDASCLLLSTIMVPDDTQLRKQYAAELRIQKAGGHPAHEPLLTKSDHVLAAKFKRHPRIDRIIQTRRLHSALAGAVLWNLHTAAATQPGIASKNKIEFTIDRISSAQNKIGSRATLRSAWRQFRPVIHWCAAVAYQSRVFGSVFPHLPEIGYVGDVVILDFLVLGRAFLEFASENVDFPGGQRPAFWTTSNIAAVIPRRPDWPDAHLIRPGIEHGPEFLGTASRYVVERDGLARKWITDRPSRRRSKKA
jgi:hypothetical protein